MSEAQEISKGLDLGYDTVLAAVTEAVKSEFKTASSLANGGATVYLDAEADQIWDAAVKLSIDRWLGQVSGNALRADLDVSALRKIAQAATPGAWHQGRSERWDENTREVYSEQEPSRTSSDICTTVFVEDAEFVSTFDPTTVLGLLDRLTTADDPAECQNLSHTAQASGQVTTDSGTGDECAHCGGFHGQHGAECAFGGGYRS